MTHNVPKMQRVSYSIPPPNSLYTSDEDEEDVELRDEQQAKSDANRGTDDEKAQEGAGEGGTLFRLPTYEEGRASKLSRTGPLLIPSTASRKRRRVREGSSAGDGPSGAGGSGKYARHPKHTLAVTSLAIDLTTPIDTSPDDGDDDQDEEAGKSGATKGPRPQGILYTAARDGMTASWDLHLPMTKEPFELKTIGNTSSHHTKQPSRSDSEWLNRSPSPFASPEGRIFRKDAPTHQPGVTSPLAAAAAVRSQSSGTGGLDSEVSSLSQSRSRLREWRIEQPFWSHYHIRRGSLTGPILMTRSTGATRKKDISFRQSIQSHTDWVNDIVLCNNNQTLISASSDRTIKAWNPHDPQSHFKAHILGTHDDYVKCLALAPKVDKIFTGGFDKRVKLWDLGDGRARDGEPIFQLGPDTNGLAGTPGSISGQGAVWDSSVYALATEEAANLVAIGSTENYVAIWDTRSRKQVAKLIGHSNNVRSLLLSVDGKHLLSGSSDATVRLWSVAEQRCLHTFEHHNDSVWSLYSDHPELDVFYSGDRQGYVCKVDWDRTDDVEEGECVVLCRDVPSSLENGGKTTGEPVGKASQQQTNAHRGSTAAAWSKRHKLLTHSGIHKIVAAQDAYFWTASSNSSSVKMWEDVPRKSQREGLVYRSIEEADRNESSMTDPAPDAASTAPRTPTRSDQFAKQQSNEHLGRNGIPFGSLVSLEPVNDLYGATVGLGSMSVNRRKSSVYFGDGLATASRVSMHHLLSTSAGGATVAGVPRSSFALGRSPMERESMSAARFSFSESPVSGATRFTGLNSPTGTTVAAAAAGGVSQVDGAHGSPGTPTTSLRFASDSPHPSTPPSGHPHGTWRASQSSAVDPTSRTSSPPARSPVNPLHAEAFLNSSAAETESSESDTDAAMRQASMAYEERELAEDAVPLCRTPVETIRGTHGLIRSSMLNDRRHVVTIDTAAQVAVWDIVRGKCLGTFDRAEVLAAAKEEFAMSSEPKEAWQVERHTGEVLDLVRDRIEGSGATPLWCTAETRAGQLTVHLQDPRCFDAEIYLDEASFLQDVQLKEDQRTNLGKWVLRNLFDAFVRVEVAARKEGLPRVDLLAAEDPDKFKVDDDQLPKTPLNAPSEASADTSSGLAVGLASPIRSPAILAEGRPFTPGSTRGLDQLLTSLRTPRSESTTDYFGNAAPVPKASEEDAKRAEATGEDDQSATPSGSGIFGRFKRSKTKSERISGKRKDGTNEAAVAVVDEKHEVTAEPEQVKIVREVVSKPVNPLPSADYPSFEYPEGTSILFSESSVGAGQFEVTYRGLVDSAAADVAALELASPHWLLALLLQGEATPRPPVKLSFTLSPWKHPAATADGLSAFGIAPQPMPDLPSGNATLSATHMLRMKKVAVYIAEKLAMQMPRARDDSIAGSRRPSLAAGMAMSSLTSTTAAPPGRDTGESGYLTVPAHEVIELLCDGTVLPPDLTLVQCRRFLWKQPGDLKLEYRLKATE